MESSNLDARTKETAATLLGVAFKGPKTPPKPAEIPENRLSSDAHAHGHGRAHVRGNPTAPPPSLLDHPPTQPPPPARSHLHAYPAAGPASYHLQQQQQQHQLPVYHSTSTTTRPQHADAQQPKPAAHHHPIAADANTALSMSSIGFGIDSSASASWGDATEAAVRALQDAMERSTLRLPMAMPSQHLLQIKVQLGVPSKQLGSSEPMVVDVSRLTAILPRAIPVLPIRVVVGGLFIAGETQGSPSICTAVACVTLQSLTGLAIPDPPASRSHPSIQSTMPHSSPWASLEGHQSHAPVRAPSPARVPAPVPVPGPSPSPEPSMTSHTPQPVVAAAPPRAGNTPEIPKLPSAAHPATSTANTNVHRSNSIEMLAMISEEIRLAGDRRRRKPNGFAPGNAAEGQATTAIQRHLSRESDGDYSAINAGSNAELNGEYDDAQFRNGSYNYKKLPPGVTTKNNRRLFVKHTYRDHSVETPLPEEQDLVGNPGTSSARTPNAAFPLKLHETLTQIETNGHADIIGWMPHGRSFKIHKQKEFAEIILPRYFVMTKKSSFLRQLNLYGFNRFSAGLDQGSYYHEKFLRGMKFLCRRMTRQKVNGNRIRSAGNPDEEPNLSAFPTCPPTSSTTANPTISSPPLSKRVAYVSREEDEDGEDNDGDDQGAEDEDEYDDEKSEKSSSSPTGRTDGAVTQHL